MARNRILIATEGAVPVPQLGRIGVEEQAEIPGGVVHPSLHDGRDIPLLEARRLVDGLRIHRRTDVGLRQGNVVGATGVRRPGIDPVIRIAGRSGQIGILVDDSVRGDRVGRLRHAIALDQIEIQGRTRDGRSRGDTREIELHHDGIGDLVVRPRIEIERGLPCRVYRIDVQIGVTAGTDHGGCRPGDRVGAGRTRSLCDRSLVLTRHHHQPCCQP